jgi:mevalonate kinase
MAYLMSEYDPSLKSQMIGKIIDVQSSKSTQQFVNSKKDVWDPTKSLITGVLDTYDYGVQQDSSHLTDEDDISSLTQVITAIAINGQNAELAEELYELLGQITAD